MSKKRISINRAPVLTLWATLVARRLGMRKGEALSLGKAVAGLNARSKGRRLGIIKPRGKAVREARKQKQDQEFFVEICGRDVPAVNADNGIRAVRNGRPIDPSGVEQYLEGKFGDDLSRVEAAMQKLAKAYRPKELEEKAYSLYEEFRPAIPPGKKGWGAEGDLNLKLIERLADRAGKLT